MNSKESFLCQSIVQRLHLHSGSNTQHCDIKLHSLRFWSFFGKYKSERTAIPEYETVFLYLYTEEVKQKSKVVNPHTFNGEFFFT